MRNFDLLEPKSAAEASRMMADHGDEARLLAGGTALLLGMRQRLLNPTHVVYLGGVAGLDAIVMDERGGLRIGALARHADVAASTLVRKHFPMLADMAGRIANPQVRSQATMGGNLCYGDPASDPPTCLLALDASVIVTGAKGDRSMPLEEFFVDYYQTALQPDEVMTEIRVPAPGNAAGRYTRFLKTPAEHRPLVGVAVVAARDAGLIRGARIAIGASTPMPTRAKRAEAFLEGKKPTPALLDEAAAMAAAEITALSDFRGTEEYRRQMVSVVVRRTAATLFDLS